MVYTSYIYEQGVKKQVFTLCSNKGKQVKPSAINERIKDKLLDGDVEQVYKAQSTYYIRLVTGKIIKL